MKNPWVKKNPFLSMWLSGANAAAGTVRGRAMAEARRQATSMMTQGSRQMMDIWSEALTPPRKKKRRKSP